MIVRILFFPGALDLLGSYLGGALARLATALGLASFTSGIPDAEKPREGLTQGCDAA